jgi:hypothetical protein
MESTAVFQTQAVLDSSVLPYLSTMVDFTDLMERRI